MKPTVHTVSLSVGLLCLALIPLLGQGRGGQPKTEWHVSTSAELMQAVAATGVGRTIYVSPGTYVLTEPLILTGENHVNIIGGGWDTVIHRTGPGEAIVFDGCGFCMLRDLMVTGSDGATDGIAYRGNSSSNIVDHSRISGFAESGLRYEGLPESPMSSNTVRDSHFIDNVGTQLRSHWNNDFFIIGNQFGCWQTAPNVGAWLSHSSAGTYSMNYHWGNDVAFRMGPGADYNRIENNRFEQSRQSGIIIGNPDEPDQWNRFNTFVGNTIHTNSEGNMRAYDAVVAYDSHDTIFTGNQIFSWYPPTTQHRSGLVLGRGSDTWIVKENIFRHNSGPAIVYDEGAGHIVGDNLVDTKPWGE